MSGQLIDSTELLVAAPRRGARLFSVALGAAVVAAAAQVAVPVPFSPVPWTLQPVAVLVVGGLLGMRGGAAALTLYLAAGLAGLPVFANVPGLPQGVARLAGPTGGYLLAFPVAALVAGAIATHTERPGVLRVLVACAAGMTIIHLGGAAQLAALTGDLPSTWKLGLVPFLTGDLLKIGLAATAILVGGKPLRSLL
ncbi:MAG: biotin transporter BioY [Gemmatimonadales bacterium]|nr:biotin transporter BioY [Gemmatimonadales bacterium]